jgi:preprotein translocase subunit SecE
MSTPRRSTNRRPSASTASANGAASAGTIDAPVDEAELAAVSDAADERRTAAEIRAARAEERRYRAEEPAQQSVLAERTGRIRNLFADTRAEIKKISWPDRETTRNLTLVVIGVSIVLGIVLGGIDYILFQIFEALP